MAKHIKFENLASCLNPFYKSVVYIAQGQHYVDLAHFSAESLKENNLDIQVIIFADRVSHSEKIDFCIELVSVFGNETIPRTLALKAAILSKLNIGPYLYLDADTFVCGNIAPLWKGLEHYSVLMAQDTWRYIEIYQQLHSGFCFSTPHPSIPYYNGGVLLTQGTLEVQEFLAEWAEMIILDTRFVRDQLALRLLIERKKSRFGTIPQEYNARTGDPLQLSGFVYIIHENGSPLTRRIECLRLSSIINKSTMSRLRNPGLRRIVCIQYSDQNMYEIQTYV